METIFYPEIYLVLGALIAINLFKDYEKKIRVIDNQKGVSEGKNPLINTLDIILIIGSIIIEFINLKWYWAIVHFIVLFFISPFLSSLIAMFLPEKPLSALAIILKVVFIILLLTHIIF